MYHIELNSDSSENPYFNYLDTSTDKNILDLTEIIYEENIYSFKVKAIGDGETYESSNYMNLMNIAPNRKKQVVDTLCRAREDAQKKCEHLHVNFILCMMILGEESLTHELNEETLYLAKEYQHKGVVAVDLAGAEGMSPMEDFRGLFSKAQELGLIYTIHAGESYGPVNIEKALSFGALRIGHGTSAIKDEKVMALLKEKRIPLEVCVTSNIHSEAIAVYEEHPIKEYMERGIPVCICTDNMTISDTNLDKEYDVLLQKLGFSIDDLLACNQNALKHSFASEKEKQELFELFRR